MKKLTLAIVKKNDEVLLGFKKRGFGVGRWNGFGGKVEESETIIEAAKRELFEESFLIAEKLNEFGILNFKFEDETPDLEVHIFLVDEFIGEAKETEEMLPKWFKVSDIPYSDMWADDRFWLPLLIANKKFRGEFLFDRPSNLERPGKIISQKLEEII